MHKITFGFLLVVLLGCGVEKQKSEGVYFAGKIVNPTDSTVILYQGEEPICSATLDADDRFVMTLDKLEDGLYHFLHYPEIQYLYLEKGDSLQIRLNTMDFDESLVFSGRGEAVNNFLLEQFLNDAEESHDFYQYYPLDPKAFSKKVDSLHQKKIQTLKALDQEVHLSPGAYAMAEASIDYGTFFRMEAYPIYHKKRTHSKELPELPIDFYSYRNRLNFNSEKFTYLRPYFNFMQFHINNVAYMSCDGKCDMNIVGWEKAKLHYNVHKLQVIDSLVEARELKDNLSRAVAVDYMLIGNDNLRYNKEFLDHFHTYNPNNTHTKEIDRIYFAKESLQPNKEFPDLHLYNTSREKVSLKNIVESNKEVVFYFWTGVQKKAFVNACIRIDNLSKKYPQYTFIGINFKTDYNNWISMMKSQQLDESKQFYSDDFETLSTSLIVYPLNKAIVTKDGKIVDAFADIYRSF